MSTVDICPLSGSQGDNVDLSVENAPNLQPDPQPGMRGGTEPVSLAEIELLQAQIRIDQLEREIEQLRAAVDECVICGGRPCSWSSFCAACKRADRRRWRKP
jgi:hypothetical protein